jgi:hypothetical protein
MDRKKIVIIYDASYLQGKFQSVKAFILQRHFSGTQTPGVIKSLFRKIGGAAASDKLVADSTDLFLVREVIPKETIKRIDAAQENKEAAQKVLADLLANGGTQVDLALDTVISESHHVAASDESEFDTEEKILQYASRVVWFNTHEPFDLAIIATESESLLQGAAELANKGEAVIGVKSEHLTGTRRLHDRLLQLANLNAPTPLTLEN